MIRTGFLSLAVLILSAVPAFAAPFTINGTGVTGWTVDGGAVTATPPGFPITPAGPWIANGVDSIWIQPPTAAPSTSYSYKTTFDLTGLNPATAQFSFQAAVDNEITDVLLNGQSLGFTYGQFTAFSAAQLINNPSFFVNGVNTLEFVVFNGAGSGGNPTGLQVRFFDATADAAEVPEPASLAVWGLVTVVGSAVAYRRRRKANSET